MFLFEFRYREAGSDRLVTYCVLIELRYSEGSDRLVTYCALNELRYSEEDADRLSLRHGSSNLPRI